MSVHSIKEVAAIDSNAMFEMTKTYTYTVHNSNWMVASHVIILQYD